MMPPSTRLCILYEKTFLPRLRAASSSSRMLFSTRPHGLRISEYTRSDVRATSDHPMMIMNRS